MSGLRKLLWSRDDTQPWKGAYAPYDLVKELCIAVGVVALLSVLLAVLFSSPNEKPSSIAQWANQKPVDFLTAATTELDGKSGTAGYGPPYNENGEGQHAWFLRPQKWLGVSHPINTAYDYVLEPLAVERPEVEPTLKNAVALYQAAPAKTQLGWAEAYEKALEKASAAPDGSVTVPAGGYGPVAPMMSALLDLAKGGDLDGDLITSSRFFQTDYTKALLFMADGGLLAERAEHEHLLGDQWGMMNETGSYPGQAWLWLYAFWYQIEPFKNSENADILVMLIMTALSIAFVCIPLIPGVRDLPRKVPIYKLIWKEHYRRS
jgi:hypothetical protein